MLWKTSAAAPRDLTPCAASRSTYAVVSANSRSGAGPESLRLPRSASRKPMAGRLRRDGQRAAALELLLVALQPRDALLDRRVGREQAGDGLADRGDEERLHLTRAQILLGDLLVDAADLHQRRGQAARPPGDDRRAAIR